MKSSALRRPLQSLTHLAMILALTGCAVTPATQPSRPAIGKATSNPAEPVNARSILTRMARRLAGSPAYSVTLQSSYDVMQPSGQKIEFNETREVTLKRPNYLRIEVEESNGEQHQVYYDGTNLTAYSPSQNVYAQTVKPGGIDQAVIYFLKDLNMRLPLAMLLLSRFPDEIEKRTLDLDYVEWANLEGVPTHHLAGRTEAVDYQVWVAAGDDPLPVRIVLTYPTAAGQPEFRARFSDWDFSLQNLDEKFIFQPPNGARKIGFQAEMPQVSPMMTADKPSSGEQP
ncbi:MAG: DUF2092 domain-containing protein [Methylococcus sp.]